MVGSVTTASDEMTRLEPSSALIIHFGDRWQLAAMRRIVGRFAVAAGCPDDRAQDIVLAISELATNSLLHGGGTGRMAYWCDSDTIVCEIRDRGSTLAVPARPGGPTARAGHGLRLVAAVCDDVSRATTHDGMVTRVTFRY